MLYYHLKEIYFRFIYWIISWLLCSLILWEYKYYILYYICPIQLIITELIEGFINFIWLSILISFIINSWYLIYQFILFITPGLNLYEYNNLKFKLIYFYCLLNLSLVFIITIVFPNILIFFLEFTNNQLTSTIKFNDFNNVIVSLIYLALFLSIIPELTNKLLIGRKYWYIILFFISALITPPDIISLILVSIPSIIVLELSLFLLKLNNNIY